MIINEEGTYTLKYTATDECGKSSTVDRELVVTDNSPRRTVLYTDGTFIINEKQVDEAHNIELHGAATNVYAPFDPNGATDVDKYIFSAYTTRPWHSEINLILSVEIGSEINPTSTAYWFYGMFLCTSIDVENLDTSSVTNMSKMFNNCNALTDLDVSGFNTSNVTDMSSMFGGCWVLPRIDISNFDTGKVVNMGSMFSNCRNATLIDVSGFDTHLVENMSNMFRECYMVSELDLSSFDTSNVTTMENMFQEVNAIQTIDASNFNTSNVTTMKRMFYECDNLTLIDISGFNVSSVTNMQEMFSYVDNLVTIYAPLNFDTSNVSTSTNMFVGTSRLVGGAGTTWSSSNPKDKTYAHIDGGTSNPGYFTAKS